MASSDPWASMDQGDPNRYVAQYAPTGRSKCKDTKCGKPIGQGEMRIGKITYNPFADDGDTMTVWYHPACMLSTCSRMRKGTKRLETLDDLLNFDDWSAADRKHFKTLLSDATGSAGTTKKTAPKKKTKAKAKPKAAAAAAGVRRSRRLSADNDKDDDDGDDDDDDDDDGDDDGDGDSDGDGDDDPPPATKRSRPAKKKKRPPCQYGAMCYRKNPVHKLELSHPGDSDYDDDNDGDDGDDGDDDGAAAAAAIIAAGAAVPIRGKAPRGRAAAASAVPSAPVDAASAAAAAIIAAGAAVPIRGKAPRGRAAAAAPAAAPTTMAGKPPPVDTGERTFWKPQCLPNEGGICTSRYGGRPALKPGETHPTCGECGALLSFMFQINLHHIPEDAQDIFGDKGLVQLFYCTADACSGWEPFSAASLARVLDPSGLVLGTEQFHAPAQIVSWEEADKPEYPNWEERESLDGDFPDDFDEEYTPEGGDKLWGWPDWVQGMEYPACPRCNETMSLLFQHDGSAVEYMFGDAGCGHITRCPTHPDVVAFAWACG